MKTSELTGAALDWAVASAKGYSKIAQTISCEIKDYSTDWAQGGPIIEREVICLLPHANGGWVATVHGVAMPHKTGETPLIAAMRCYVASKLGDEVDIPEELQ